MSNADTIYAPATLRGQAGLAVVRVSGEKAAEALVELSGEVPEARRLVLRRLVDPFDGFLIDEGLVVFFEAGSSFTGEPVAEFQVHGSEAVVNGLCSALSRIPGFRHAQEGEFTARAFRNGRIDLTQVEGLADLISAETREQHRLANRVFSGELGATVEDWRQKLLQSLALLEATIDFSDEELPDGLHGEVKKSLVELGDALQEELDGYAAARRIRDGLEIAIVGRPNAGKSTLLNRLAGRDAAITSEVEGTTRDVIEVRMHISGRSVRILDTAGVRATSDKVEKLGVSRTLNRAKEADIRVFLLLESDSVADLGVPQRDEDIVVAAKADLSPNSRFPGVSGTTGMGVDLLFKELEERVVRLSCGSGTVSKERQRDAVANCLSAVTSCLATVEDGLDDAEIAADFLTSAVRALDTLVGRIDVEDVLGKIFSNFCIGK